MMVFPLLPAGADAGRARGADRVLFVGDDWAEDHHDVELQDTTGRRLARARLPEGLAGLRLDVALSRLLGLSRTVTATLIDAGQVLVDGDLPVRSDKVSEGAWLEVTLPAPREHDPITVVAEPVSGLRTTGR